jgi:hypothetical protein
MNINRNNYEEYFILYLDNELEGEDRRQVEAFAQENPDLKAELDMLLQSKLTADTDISFTDKGSLMRFGNSSISLANYEEWLTAYIDNELTEEERKDVEVFLTGNPAIQRELNLLQKTKLQPEAIVFPHKESLYHREEKAGVVSIRWWRIAAAAVLLLGIGTTAIVLINKNSGNNNTPEVAVQPKEKKSTDDNAIKQPGNARPIDEQVADTADQKKFEPVIKETSNPIAIKQKNIKEEKKEQPVPVKEEQPLIANNKEDRTNNNLPQPTEENIYATGKADIKNSIPQTTNPLVETVLTNNNADAKTASVTPETLQPSYAVEQQSSGNKGLRGFLRKVTRTFEKRTNIKATDDDDRLLIAGLAIKMN